jgi:hypothetical protein
VSVSAWAARYASTTRAAHVTGSESTTTAMSSTTTAMSAAATMHLSKSGGRKSQCQSRDVKNCSHHWFTSVVQIDCNAKTFHEEKLIADQLVVISPTRGFYELTTELIQRNTWE